MKRTFAAPTLGAALALALLLSGCGEQSSNTSSATSSRAGSGTIDNDLGAQFSGGSDGKAANSATPITVGMINQEGGPVSNPEGSDAVQAAFDYLNAEQNGIGGHPLKLVVCKVTGSEEEAQQCAQRFLNDDSISVVLQGGLNVGTDAVHTTLNGAKPDVIATANPGSDTTAKNAFAVNPSVLAALPGFATYAAAKGYKSHALVVSSNPGDLAIGQAAQADFAREGVTAKITTFPAGSTDLTSAFTAALSSRPDAVTPVVATTAGCTAAAKALTAIGSRTPVIVTGLCATDAIKTALGDFPQWAFEADTLSLFAPDSTGQVDFYKSVMAKYASDKAQIAINAPASFGAAFVVAKALNSIGPDRITPQSVSKAMKSYTGGVLLGTPKVKFGSVSGMPTLSGLGSRFYIYGGKDKWTTTDWQSLPR